MSDLRTVQSLDDYPIEIQEEFLKSQIKDHCKESLFHLAKNILGYKDLTIQTHGPITRILESESKKKLIVVPRGCFKSTICSIAYPFWLLIKDPNHRILLDSELYSNSSRFLREISAHMQSKQITDLFGEFRSPESIWRDGEVVIKQRTKVFKEPSILCSGVDANKTGMHFDTIIADDLSSLNNSMTDDQCERVFNHYRLYVSLLEPGGTIVVVGTRYSQRDLIGYILSEITNDKRPGLIY